MTENLFPLAVERSMGTRNETSPICCLPGLCCSLLCFAQFWWKGTSHLCWGQPSHCRGHPLGSVEGKRTDLSWQISDAHLGNSISQRAAFCWEHCCCVFFLQGAVQVEHAVLYVSQYLLNELQALSFKGLLTCPKTAQRTQVFHFKLNIQMIAHAILP